MAKEKITQEQLIEIIGLNKKYVSTLEIAKKFNVSTTTIRSYFKKQGIPLIKINKGSVKNRNYFEEINNSTKAYILGWMFSDGNVYIKNKVNYRVSLNVQEQDRFICDLMQKEIGGTINFIDNSSKNWKNQIRFTVNSEFLTNDLINLGCIPNKTHHELSIPDIPKDLIIDFIRGVFDGDGCISFQKKDKTITFKISCNSEQFLNKIGSFLLNFNISKYRVFKHKSSNCYNLEIKRKNDIVILYHLLYSSPSYNLQRKKNKWEEYMSKINYK